ncbi:MAG: glycosyltransferase [Cytophagales bacterium]|nr:MAG: glycosyltransferase [Cytophagales bacterium]
MNLPKITIITPSFNQGAFIEQTIESVLSQNYPALEYFIFDGGSTDNTLNIIKRYEKHISYYVSAPDRGQSHAINQGIERATGKVINWLNADDFYMPDALRLVGECFEDPNTKVVMARSRIFEHPNKTVSYSKGTDFFPKNLSKTIGQARIDQPETFFRKEAFDAVGLLNEHLHYLMDREWWIRYLLHFGLEGILPIEAVIVNFRLHNQSKTMTQQKHFAKERAMIWAAFAEMSSVETVFIEKIKKLDSIEITDDLNFSGKTIPNTNQATEILQYYALLRAEECYCEYDAEATQQWLQLAKMTIWNDKMAQKWWRRLWYRNQIPVFLRKFIQKQK